MTHDAVFVNADNECLSLSKTLCLDSALRVQRSLVLP